LSRPKNMQKFGWKNTFLPPGSIPVERWMHQRLIKFNKGTMEVGGTSGTKQAPIEIVSRENILWPGPNGLGFNAERNGLIRIFKLANTER
jgi:hypothetical protein